MNNVKTHRIIKLNRSLSTLLQFSSAYSIHIPILLYLFYRNTYSLTTLITHNLSKITLYVSFKCDDDICLWNSLPNAGGKVFLFLFANMSILHVRWRISFLFVRLVGSFIISILETFIAKFIFKRKITKINLFLWMSS